ncbi:MULTISPECIES: hypothetical protein [Salinibaculum]|uniref:hypothetical protein n=1 Tax=Salinibaculum TaxID=2732368 RepID=UPI0030CADB41
MATVAVLADPPVEGFVLSGLPGTTPLTAAEATELYSAMLTDVCRAIQDSGADLLVNYRDSEQVPGDVDSEQRLRDVLSGDLEQPSDVRYEVQVGETFAGRAGNTATHLLNTEAERTVALVEPTGPFLGREEIGSAAMKLRNSDVVLGPGTGGRVYFAGFAEPVDFDDAYAAPAIETLTDRARDADLDVDFLPQTPVVESGADLADLVTQVRARLRAGRKVPVETATVIDSLGLYAESTDDGLTVARTSDSS